MTTISFFAEVGVEQQVVIVQQDLTPDALIEGMKKGDFLTTIDYDLDNKKAPSIIRFDDEGEEVVVAEIISQRVGEDRGSYHNFELVDEAE